MFSFASKRIVAFLFTARVVAPMFFLAPVTVTPKVGVSIAEAAWCEGIPGCGIFAFNDGCGLLWWRCAARDSAELLLVKVPALFFGLAGIVFDTLIAFSLSSTVIKNQDFVNTGWVIMRDLSNTFFIFILLYIAIATILQTAGGQTMRLLATLVMVALFMNFSLYITKFVIDVGNVFALEFYVNMGEEGKAYIETQDIEARSISATFKDAFNLENLLGPDFLDGAAQNLPTATFVFVLVGIMYLVATFVFLSAGFLFLARVVAFWFLMILSPLAFMSMILPYTRSKIWGKWSSELVNQTFFAPIFLFFVYLTLILSKTVGDLFVKGSDIAGNMDFLQTAFISFLTFFALITTLLFGLKTAKSMSGELGASMTKIGGAVTGAAVGGAAWAGRNSFGLGARRLLARKDEEGRTLEDRMRASKTGNLLLKSTGDFGAKSSFDVRNVGVGGYTVGGGAKSIGGMDIGQGSKGNQSAQFAEKVKANSEEINKIQDPKLRAKALHSLTTGVLPSDKDAAFEVYAKMSSKDRADMAAKSPEYQDMFQGFAQRMGAKDLAENHKEALANAKDVRDKNTGAITTSKDAVRAEYLHSMEDFGTKGLSGQKLADQYAKNRIAQREALETMSPDDVSDMLTAAKNNATPLGTRQVKAIEETIARTGQDKQIGINQAILRDVVEKTDPRTGVRITSAEQRAAHINAITDPVVKKTLWSKESADMRAEILATPAGSGLQSVEDLLSADQREQTRNSVKRVNKRNEVAANKEEIRLALASVPPAALPTAAVSTKIADAMKTLNSKQRADLGFGILKNPEVSKHLKLEDLSAMHASDGFTTPEMKTLVEGHAAKLIRGAAADPVVKDQLKTLYKNKKVFGLLDDADQKNVINAI